jgi:scyllo-inositol 2-dehydrogenase (NADP+)
MLKAGVVGLGKMGLSHQAILNAHPEVQVTSVCDTSAYVLDILSKYTGVRTYTDYKKMLASEELDCVLVATPSRYHAELVQAALDKNLHVFCEKPFALDPDDGYRLADLAERKGLVNQVGYHYRYVAAFSEAKRILDAKLIGKLHHLQVEAYGPVVLRAKGGTWRSKKSEGGGCLYDYACHAIDLMNFLVGRPANVSGTIMNGVFSSDVEDEIYADFQFSEGFSGHLASNWSDESFRKMSLKVSVWGTNGRLNVDRQALQVYLRSLPEPLDAYAPGWNERFTTELTPPTWFYMRGEEYSAQINHFVECVKAGKKALSNFRTASDASLVASKMREDTAKPRTIIESKRTEERGAGPVGSFEPRRSKSFLRAILDKL